MAAVTIYVAPTGYVYHRRRDCYQLSRAKEVKRAKAEMDGPGATIRHAKWGERFACGVCATFPRVVA